MLAIKKKQRSLILVLSITVLASSMDAATSRSRAKETPQQDPLENAEVISDLSAEELAREILMLQKQMGGSIVPTSPNAMPTPEPLGKALITDKTASQGWPDQPPLYRAAPVARQLPKVEALRDAAFGLDNTAHRLEELDLYEQADALRNVATRLRHDARELKQRLGSVVNETPRRPLPTPPARPTLDRK